ncbi:carbon-nitrogen hydrolase family protein [Phyllobacterium meliloti]|uniref:carbon-nitrogen hydrolase family protein n=1 Tax=Phyllobacterium meliloti TaxID=555317 RepID=UPI001D133133|nr:carbon-nitrogen hydrolase family protein [Phyllobacterium sp. T1293]UGX87049.1 carbon-nitrogen hydrolase family protein [Phyllobacterium sp. T1293]
MKTVRVAAAQTIEYLEDIESALTCIADVSRHAETEGARLLLFPEAFLQGYLTEESSARRIALDFSSEQFKQVLDRFPKTGPTIVIGIIEASSGELFNSAAVIDRGTLVGYYRKTHLLQGEKAFSAGKDMPIFAVGGVSFGINICYDTNFPMAARRIADLGATLIVCPANNMMPRERAETYRDQHNIARGDRCLETGLWLISADVTGEREGCVSWGPTAILNPDGEVVWQLPLDKPGLLIADIPYT